MSAALIFFYNALIHLIKLALTDRSWLKLCVIHLCCQAKPDICSGVGDVAK